MYAKIISKSRYKYLELLEPGYRVIGFFDASAERELRAALMGTPDEEDLEDILAELRRAPLALVLERGSGGEARVKLPSAYSRLAEGIYSVQEVYDYGGRVYAVVEPCSAVETVDYLEKRGIIGGMGADALLSMVAEERRLRLVWLAYWVAAHAGYAVIEYEPMWDGTAVLRVRGRRSAKIVVSDDKFILGEDDYPEVASAACTGPRKLGVMWGSDTLVTWHVNPEMKTTIIAYRSPEP